MDKLISTLRSLTKLASELDAAGRTKEANLIDEALMKIAQQQELQPVGEIWTADGKTYRKFYSERLGLVTKEVDASGVPLTAPSKPGTTPATETKPEPSWFEKYNPFPGLISALSGEPAKVVEQEQEHSEVPWVAKSDDTMGFTGPNADDNRADDTLGFTPNSQGGTQLGKEKS